MHGKDLQQLPVVTWFLIKGIFPDLLLEQQLEMSSQFMASFFNLPLVVRIHGKLSQQ